MYCTPVFDSPLLVVFHNAKLVDRLPIHGLKWGREVGLNPKLNPSNSAKQKAKATMLPNWQGKVINPRVQAWRPPRGNPLLSFAVQCVDPTTRLHARVSTDPDWVS